MDRPPGAPRPYNPFAPDLGRARRHFPRQSNPTMWLLPLVAFAVMVAAVMRLIPDLSRPRAAFAPAYVEAHEKAIREVGRASVNAEARSRIFTAQAETIAVHLRLTPGLYSRADRTARTLGGGVLSVRKNAVYFEHQLHLILTLRRVRGWPVYASLFEERIGSRNLDAYRRREIDGERYFISSAAAPKTPPDSVIVWTEGRMLFTLVGRAPEDTLLGFAHRLTATPIE